MPTRKGYKPGTYVVRNATKRLIVRDEVRFPARSEDGKASRTTVEVTSFEQWFRLEAAKHLELEYVGEQAEEKSEAVGEPKQAEEELKRAEELKQAEEKSEAGTPARPFHTEAGQHVDLESLGKGELVRLAEQAGVPASGTRAVLVERIRAARGLAGGATRGPAGV